MKIIINSHIFFQRAYIIIKRMLNLNLMHTNDEQSNSYSIQDSTVNHHQSIKAQNTYELNSNSESEEQGHNDEEGQRQSFEIDHSLDDLSMDHDTFLETLQRERITDKIKTVHQNIYQFKSASSMKYLTVDKTSVEKTFLQTQSTEQAICFTNITSYSLKLRLNECPFQIHTEKSLTYVQAKQLQIVLQPFQQVSITFLIKSDSEDYGDIIETVVITSEFIGRDQSMAPLQINFNIHYVQPKLKIKFLGKSQGLFMTRNKISVVRLKSNKLGEYSLDISLNEGCPKMNVAVQTRGKMTSFTSSLTLSSKNYSSVKLRRKLTTHQDQREKYVLILKSTETKLCFLLGIQFIS